MHLCETCGIVTEQDLQGSPALRRLQEWQDKLALFWGTHPWVLKLLQMPVPFLCLAIMCAFYEETRHLTVYFVVAAVVIGTLREFIPLTPVPFNVYNVVTSRGDAYYTAARMGLLSLVALAFVGAFVTVSEQLGTVRVQSVSGFNHSPRSYWSDSVLPWITCAILVVPTIYFSSLVVSNTFVAKRLYTVAA